MKKQIYKFLFVLVAVAVSFSSCGDSDIEGVGGLVTSPDDKFDAKICVFSALKDGATATTDEHFAPITKFLKEKRSDAFLAIVDRADITYATSGMKNGVMKTVSETNRYNVHAFNRFNGQTMESSCLLFKNLLFEGEKNVFKHNSLVQSSHKMANDCYSRTISQVILNGTNSALPEGEREISYQTKITTIRITSPDHITAFLSADKGGFGTIKITNPIMLYVGTVKSSIANNFKEAVTTLDDHYEVTIAEGTESAEYSIFILGHKSFWALKNTEKESLGNGIDAYTLSLKW